MIQPIKIIAIFVYRLNEGNPHIPGSLSATLGYHFKSLSIMDNSIQTIFASEDLRLDRVHLPLDESGNKTTLVYNLYIRVNSKQHELCEDVARDLDYTYMDTDEYDGLKPTPGIEYDHYFKFI